MQLKYFIAQKGSKDIDKIVHVASVVHPKCNEAAIIIFVRHGTVMNRRGDWPVIE